MFAAPAAAAVATCRTGAYVTDLYALDLVKRTVGAEVWFWSVCPRPDLDPTRRFELINATEYRETDRMGTRRGSAYWSLVKITGTFRLPISMADYPFDRHIVSIIVEETRDASQFVHTVDSANSTYNPGIRLGDYKITSFRTRVADHIYRTNFGDPLLRPGAESRYSELIIQLTIARTDITGFIKETWPAYVAFLVALTSFLLWSSDTTAMLGARLGMLGASLFTIVVNLRSASQSLGTFSGVTLVDQVHLYTLVYVLVGIAFSTYAWRVSTHPGRWATGRRINHAAATGATVLYVAANVTAISLALAH